MDNEGLFVFASEAEAEIKEWGKYAYHKAGCGYYRNADEKCTCGLTTLGNI
jgi:hypothetical protein